MNWIVTLVVGGITGWLASLVMKTNAQMGIVANVIVGIVGAGIGGWLSGALGIATGGGVMSWIVAVGGAAILLAVLRALGLFK